MGCAYVIQLRVRFAKLLIHANMPTADVLNTENLSSRKSFALILSPQSIWVPSRTLVPFSDLALVLACNFFKPLFR